MARTSRSLRLYRKGESALIAAIEIYNKPNFAYREETFAILAINAWELLLKAKVLIENSNRLRSLHVFEHRIRADGTKTVKPRWTPKSGHQWTPENRPPQAS